MIPWIILALSFYGILHSVKLMSVAETNTLGNVLMLIFTTIGMIAGVLT